MTYRERHGITDTWETRERIVVGITGRRGGDMLIRRASRMAGRVGGDLLGVHVTSEDGLSRDDAELLSVQRHLVEQLGGRVHDIVAPSPAEGLVSFAKAETDVVGISADPVKAQDRFRDKHRLAIPLASDETKKMLTAYGAWGEKSMYGRKFMGVRRTTVLIDRDGRVARVWENVKVDGHAEAVLEAAKAL